MKISDNISQGSTTSDPRSEITAKLRQTAYANRVTLATPLLLLIAAIISIVFDFGIVICFLLVIANIFSVVFIYFKIQSNQSKFTLNFRKEIATRILSQKDPTIQYEPESFIDVRNFYASGLFKLVPNVYKGENYIKITEPDYEVEFSYVHAEKAITTVHEDNSRTSSFDPVFEGVFYLFTLPIYFPVVTIIRADKTIDFPGVFDEHEKRIYGKFDKVIVADHHFEDAFDVYSNDPTQTIKLLDEGMREKLLRIRKETDASLQLSIVGKYVYATLYTEERYFTPGFIITGKSRILQKSQQDADFLLSSAALFKPVIGKIIMFDLLKK